ncbi:DUF397 domain-containing protein [Streptomyces noursei]
MSLYDSELTGAQWFSAPCGGNNCCIEAAALPDGSGYALRNSTAPEAGHIRATREELRGLAMLLPSLLEEQPDAGS